MKLRYPPRLLVFGIALALAARIVFWISTGRVWEDALITTSFAVNAVAGRGLIHHVGDGRVYGFTSALSVLIPLLAELVRSGAGVFALRIASLLAAAVSIAAAYYLGKRLEFSTPALLFLLAYLALDQNQIFYGMSGMETQMAVAVLLVGYLAIELEWRPSIIGAIGALALLARPDFVLWVGVAVLWVGRTRGIGQAARATVVTFVLVLPWLVFTQAYYGSIIPHTVSAKAVVDLAPPALSAGVLPQVVWWTGRFVLQARYTLMSLVPLYESEYIDNLPIYLFSVFVAPVAFVMLATIGLRSRSAGLRVVAAYCGVYLVFRFIFISPFYNMWYFPPFTASVALLTAAGLSRLRVSHVKLAGTFAAALAIAYGLHIPISFPLEATVQNGIEYGVRQQVGLYLHRVVRPGEPVVTEPAGYFGYYGDVFLMDYPGRVSTRVTDLLKRLPPGDRDLAHVVAAIRPPWIVLRPVERKVLQEDFPALSATYEVQQTFTSQVPLEQAGVRYFTIDRTFIVLKRRTVP